MAKPLLRVVLVTLLMERVGRTRGGLAPRFLHRMRLSLRSGKLLAQLGALLLTGDVDGSRRIRRILRKVKHYIASSPSSCKVPSFRGNVAATGADRIGCTRLPMKSKEMLWYFIGSFLGWPALPFGLTQSFVAVLEIPL